MSHYKLSLSSSKAFSLALERYQTAKSELERQRENERSEREQRAEQRSATLRRSFISLLKIALPIATCYGIYTFIQNLNANDIKGFMGNTFIFVALIAFCVNAYLGWFGGFTPARYSKTGDIFYLLSGLIYYISIPIIFIGLIVAIITLFMLIGGEARNSGDFWFGIGIIITLFATMEWGEVCLDYDLNGGGAVLDWIALINTAVLMLYSYSPVIFFFAD